MLGAPFHCNICGTENGFQPEGDWRESPTCITCQSSVRSRHVIHCLTERLFGQACTLPEIEAGIVKPNAGADAKRLFGVGLSDWPGFAEPLSRIFNYWNTFYHQEPFLDICNPAPRWSHTADFLISSDVFEHIPSPSIQAFRGAAKVLAPGGVLVLTVPFGGADTTIEHYPGVIDFKTIELGGEWLLIGRKKSGEVELHRSPVFHGGPGSTVEMRIFAYDEVVDLLARSGFIDIRLHKPPVPEAGIFMPHGFGLPITAIKG